MKNILTFLLLVIIVSCKKDNLDFATNQGWKKHQAPFGVDGNAVQVHQVFMDGNLITEFTYENNFIAKHIGYAVLNKPIHYSTGTFVRNNSGNVSFTNLTGFVNSNQQTVSDIVNTQNIVQFDQIKNDSVRETTDTWPMVKQTISKRYFFNNNGFIYREHNSVLGNSSQSYTTTHVRNAQNNIIKSTQVMSEDPENTFETKFEYDNHPNPFFKMGINYLGDFNTYASLSPNNVTQVIITDKDGKTSITNSTYEYNQNGYPSKVTSILTWGNLPPQKYAIEYTYY